MRAIPRCRSVTFAGVHWRSLIRQPVINFRDSMGGNSREDAAGHNDLCEIVHVRREHFWGSPITGVLEGFDDLAAEEQKEDGDRYNAQHRASH